MRSSTSIIIAFSCLFVLLGPGVAAGDVWFVSPSAAGSDDGTGWQDAFPHLVTALAVAQPGDRIWVAAGTYTPDPVGADRDLSFELRAGVHVYGGFAGDETDIADRDVDLHETILSGDLLGNDGGTTACGPSPDFSGDADNSYHVVRVVDVGSDTVLDGFTITGGHADGVGLDRNGAGILIDSSSVQVRRCRVVRNRAADGTVAPLENGGDGGGIFSINGSPTIRETTICSNRAGEALGDTVGIGRGGHGGGIALVASDGARLLGCSILENHAGDGAQWIDLPTDGGSGGGVRIDTSLGVLLRDCSITSNVSGRGGSANDGDTGTPGTGGGLSVTDSEVLLVACTVADNRTQGSPGVIGGGTGDGGGLDLRSSTAIVEDCEFLGNATGDAANNDDSIGSGNGGGIRAVDGPELRLVRCTFEENRTGKGGRGSTAPPGPSGAGGALAATDTALLVVSSRFVANRTGDGSPHATFACASDSGPGGAIRLDGASPASIQECLFIGNSTGPNGAVCGAVGDGGAIASELSGVSPLEIQSCTLFGNRTGPLLSPGTGGTAGGILASAGTLVDNCILHLNADATGYTQGAQITGGLVTTSIVMNWSSGGTSFSADPLFVDVLGPDGQLGSGDEDLRVLPGSPAIDSANSTIIPSDVADLDGDGDIAEPISLDVSGLRRAIGPVGGLVDIGAHEYEERWFTMTFGGGTEPIGPVRFDPVTGDATFTVSHGLLEEPDGPGFPSPIEGLQQRWVHDDTLLEVVSVEPGAALAGLSSGAGPDFFEVVGCDTDANEIPDVHTIGLIVSFSGLDTLLADGEREIARTTYETRGNGLVPGSGTATVILLQDGPGCGMPSAPVENGVEVSGIPGSRAAVVTRLTIELVPGVDEPRFTRGDCNGDGEFDLADAISFLGYAFPGTGGVPGVLGCEDSCDTNDDGDLDLADAITTLSALFAGGAPPPPPHGPDCGPDPTSDALGCRSASDCP